MVQYSVNKRQGHNGDWNSWFTGQVVSRFAKPVCTLIFLCHIATVHPPWDVCAEDLKQGAEGVTCHCVRRCSLDGLDLRSNRGCCHACYDLAGKTMIARPEQRDTFANDYHSGLARTSAPNDSLQKNTLLQDCFCCKNASCVSDC